MIVAWGTLFFGLLLLVYMIRWALQVNREEKERIELISRLEAMRIARDAGYMEPDERMAIGMTPTSILPNALRTRLARADIKIEPSHMLIFFMVLAVLMSLGAVIGGLIVGIGVGLFQIGAAWGALEYMAYRRFRAFIDALPNYFDRVRQLIVVGNTLQQALARATDSAGPAIQRYFNPLVRRMRHGASVQESLAWLSERLDIGELHMFSTAVDTHIRYGGRISDILENLIRILRDKTRMERELGAATAETRTSAAILIALPLVVGVAIIVMNPGYLDFFVEEEAGETMMMIMMGLEIAGVLGMRRLLRVDF